MTDEQLEIITKELILKIKIKDLQLGQLKKLNGPLSDEDIENMIDEASEENDPAESESFAAFESFNVVDCEAWYNKNCDPGDRDFKMLSGIEASAVCLAYFKTLAPKDPQ